MKYLETSICIIIAVSLFAGLVYADLQYYNNLSPKVKYSVNIPQTYNASAFSYYTELPDDSNHIYSSEIIQFPYSINGTERVGNIYDLRVTYYGGNITGLLNGDNIKEIPQNNELGTIHYNIQIQEINDNVVSTYDIWFYLPLITGGIIIFTICGFFALVFLPFTEDDEVTSSNDKL